MRRERTPRKIKKAMKKSGAYFHIDLETFTSATQLQGGKDMLVAYRWGTGPITVIEL